MKSKIRGYISLGTLSLVAFMGLSMPSCQSWATKNGYKHQTEVTQELEKLKAEAKIETEKKENAVSEAKDKIIKSKDDQIKEAGNSLYAADQVFETIPNPDRDEVVTNNYVNEGWAALGRPIPSYEKLVEINQQIKEKLDETRTSMEELQRDHQNTLKEKEKVADAAKKATDNLVLKEKELAEYKEKSNADILAKTGDLAKANEKIAQLEAEKANDREAIQKAKLKASSILGVISLAALAGAIWSPLWKDKFALLAAILAGMAVAVWYIQPWMIGVFVGLCLIVLAVLLVRKANKTEKVADALILANQDLKDSDPEAWKKQRSLIDERLKSYIKKDGKIVSTETPDPKLVAHIDEKLAEWDAK
jgi:hypothetical protein